MFTPGFAAFLKGQMIIHTITLTGELVGGRGMCSKTSVLTRTAPLALQGESTLLPPEPNLQSKQVAYIPMLWVHRQGNKGKAGREGEEGEGATPA